MQFVNPAAKLFVPDGLPEAAALERVTHLAIGAHQDDLEFMAFDGIVACLNRSDRWFGGVTCTNGAGSPRTGRYASYSDEQMQEVRRQEQNRAAELGQYGAMIQLAHTSATVRAPGDRLLPGDLLTILRRTRPQVVYTHNLADKHDTHIGVAVAVIEALRELPREERPEALYGCEVWRNLDWLLDNEKVLHGLSGHDALASRLNALFDSQIAGGKRYDLGVLGRRHANATFFDPNSDDRSESVAFAMDMTPLLRDDTLDIAAFADGFIERFRADVRSKLRARLGL